MRKHDTKGQCVYLVGQEEWVTVSIVGYDRREVVGTISWTPVH